MAKPTERSDGIEGIIKVIKQIDGKVKRKVESDQSFHVQVLGKETQKFLRDESSKLKEAIEANEESRYWEEAFGGDGVFSKLRKFVIGQENNRKENERKNENKPVIHELTSQLVKEALNSKYCEWYEKIQGSGGDLRRGELLFTSLIPSMAIQSNLEAVKEQFDSGKNCQKKR